MRLRNLDEAKNYSVALLDPPWPYEGDPHKPQAAGKHYELVLAFTNAKQGRPLPVLDEGMGQVVLAPRGAHSEKPATVQANIERLHGPQRRIELFARTYRDGWDAYGDQLPEEPSP